MKVWGLQSAFVPRGHIPWPASGSTDFLFHFFCPRCARVTDVTVLSPDVNWALVQKLIFSCIFFFLVMRQASFARNCFCPLEAAVMTLLQFSSSYYCTSSCVTANYVVSSGHLESTSLPLARLANEILVGQSGSSPGRTVKKDVPSCIPCSNWLVVELLAKPYPLNAYCLKLAPYLLPK